MSNTQLNPPAMTMRMSRYQCLITSQGGNNLYSTSTEKWLSIKWFSLKVLWSLGTIFRLTQLKANFKVLLITKLKKQSLIRKFILLILNKLSTRSSTWVVFLSSSRILQHLIPCSFMVYQDQVRTFALMRLSTPCGIRRSYPLPISTGNCNYYTRS